MSNNPIIPKEQMTAYQRWELAAFDDLGEVDDPLPLAESPVLESALDTSAVDAETGIAEPVEVEQPPQNIPYPTAEEMEALHQQAYQDAFGEGQKAGFEKGFEQGLSEGRQAAAVEVEQLTTMLSALDRSRLDFEAEMAEVVLNLALSLSQQILRQALSVKQDALVPLIREALASLPQVNQHPRILVNPDNGRVLRELLSADVAHFGLRIIDDESIHPGGCKIEAGSSEIDATIETRWARLLTSLGHTGDWLELS